MLTEAILSPSLRVKRSSVSQGHCKTHEQRRQPLFGPCRPLHEGRHQRRHGGGQGGEPAPVRYRGQRQRPGGRTCRRSRWAQGPLDEGGAAALDDSRGIAARVRPRIVPAPVASSAHGPCVRPPSHAGGTGSRLAHAFWFLRGSVDGVRFIGTGPSRDLASTVVRWPANCSIPTCSRPWKPISLS